MKKRIISLALTVLMLISLVPTAGLADARGILDGKVSVTFTVQPVDETVRAGENAVFTVEARIDSSYSKELKYLWLDSTDVDPNADLSLKDIIALIAKSVGKEKTLVLENVSTADSGKRYKCIAYCGGLSGQDKGFGYAVSEEATLTVEGKTQCKEHSLAKIEARPATCAAAGNIEYYYCPVCQNCYLDAQGTEQTTIAQCTIEKLSTHGEIVHMPGKAPTCAEKGCKAHWECSVCGKYFSDEQGTTEISASSVEIAKNETNHTDLQHFDRVEPTCAAKGMEEHWYCSGCDRYYRDERGVDKTIASKLEISKNSAKHAKLEYTKASAPTCEEPGNIPYWYCADCDTYFSDAEGMSKIKKSDTKLAALGHDYKWRAFSEDGVEYHAQRCERCKCLVNVGSHTGGTACCIYKATCTTCGFEYGEIDPSNHINTEKQIITQPTPEHDGVCDIYCNDCKQYVEKNVPLKYKDICEHKIVKVEEVPAQCEATGVSGTKEHYKCTVCGTLFNDAAGKSEISDASKLTIEPLKHFVASVSNTQIPNVVLQTKAYDNLGHWSVCKYCQYKYDGTYKVHTFPSNPVPTCHSGKGCLVCDYDDGTRDANNHDGGTELRGKVEPSDSAPGYTGDTYCLGCGQMIAKGRVCYVPCPDGCENTLEFVAGVPKTCYVDGIKDHYKCTVCGNEYVDKNASVLATDENLIEKHGHEIHPMIEILGVKDVAELIKVVGKEHAADILKILAGKDPTMDNFLSLVHIKDIDHCHDDEYHWLGCQICGKTLEDMQDELAALGITLNPKWIELSRKTAHTGGTATCQKKAVCDECGDEYGKLGEHRYDAVVTPATCTKDGYTTHTCSGCKDSYVDSETRKTGHKIVRGQCTECKKRYPNPFYDVPSSAYYYGPVMWAYYYTPQITVGTDETTFSPDANCTREQVVTFLWRAAGAPAPKTNACPFNDVSPKSYAYRAITWAAENGIAAGTGEGRFSPGNTVTRAEFVTFLWRFFGKPTPTNLTNPFSDNEKGMFYYDAVVWAAENGIAAGTGGGRFSPYDCCTRAQVVTFLGRSIAGDIYK